jgi:uncharacterized protein (TIGR00251 family)
MKKMKIKVKIHPNSSREEVVQIKPGEFEVWVRETPLENKANIALEKILKKHFKKQCTIIFGFKSRKKVVEIID